MDYVFLDIADSTMNYAAAHQHELGDRTMIVAHNQESGRGQRGNSWESEPGKNLTVTMLYRPKADMDPRPLDEQQFRLSEATALGVADTLEAYGLQAMVKWSNDVYVGDRKISGILIEHTIIGNRLDNSRIGIGLNVNQREFVSDAPNPVSMAQIAGHEFPLDQVMTTLCSEIAALFDRHIASGCLESLHELYIARLWRREGLHPYRDTATGERFLAAIDSIGPMGHLTLRDASGSLRTFAFKEVKSEIDTLLL